MNINGITVKAVKTFKGHDGETCFQGNLYIKGKKIAEWSQDAWNAIMDNLRMEPGYSEEKLRDAIIKKNKDKAITKTRSDGSSYTLDYELEWLMTDLIELKEAEKRYKEAMKQGYPIIIDIIGSLEIQTRWFPPNYQSRPDEDIIDFCKDNIKEVQSNCFRDEEAVTHIYRSLSDFDIGEEIALEDIKE